MDSNGIFPRISLSLNYVEFTDCLYDFVTGRKVSIDSVSPTLAVGTSFSFNFDDCVAPVRVLGLLGTVRKYLEGFDRLLKVLESFGGVFHPQLNRKENKALFLLGDPSTYKTFLAKLVLETVYGSAHIDVLARSKSRFNLSTLLKEDRSPYVLFLDDLRWDEMGMFLADFLNLLDGGKISTK